MFWKDKVVFLTGASSGIGEGLALALAERRAILGARGAPQGTT
jgi:NAD(P)-dependent dehydrogenase (short-subunit alcohol dehydrogenase family)